MTITTITLTDDAEKTITQTTDSVLKRVETVTVWKPGSAQFNRDQLSQRAQTAITNNDAYLAIPSPTQAQAVTQVAALTRQMNGLLRFNLNAYNDVSDS